MLYNVSATIICSLVYLICSHKGIRYHGVQVFVRTPIPSRGATIIFALKISSGSISIHAPLAGSDQRGPDRAHGCSISIHAPLAGSDYAMAFASLERETISIHAPLAGSDIYFNGLICYKGDFNPRSPRGERLSLLYGQETDKGFQSTLPSRGATSRMGS